MGHVTSERATPAGAMCAEPCLPATVCMMHLSFPSIITVIQGATRDTQARQSSFDPLLQQHFSQCFLDEAADEIRDTKAEAAAPIATKDKQSNGLAAAACKSRLKGVPPITGLTATTTRCSLCRMLSVYARYMLDICCLCRYMLDIRCLCRYIYTSTSCRPSAYIHFTPITSWRAQGHPPVLSHLLSHLLHYWHRATFFITNTLTV